jgi:cytoskeletal protein CcmA (bactofilin family)
MSIFGSRRQSEPETPPSGQQTESPVSALSQHPIGFETVLGANSTMEGSLSSNANVRLDGTFSGTLHISGNVLVGETAKINADIDAKNVSIAGAVRGNVTGKKVQLLRTGRVWGDINATALTTEEGAFIDGKISMQSHDAAQPSPQPGLSVPDPEVVDEMEALVDESEVDEPAEEEPALDEDESEDAKEADKEDKID